MRGLYTLIMRRLRPVMVILTAVSALVVFAFVSSPLLAARAEDRETVWLSTNTEKSDVSTEQPVDEVLAILEPPDASSGAPEIERAAQATGDGPPTWTSVVALYLHAADLKGTTTLGRIEVPVDVSFSTLIDKLQTAFTAHAETQRGPVGVGVDVLYLKVGEDGLSTGIPGITLEAASLGMTNLEFFGIGRLGDPAASAGAFDFLGGARYRRLSPGFRFSLPREMIASISGTRDWWDLLLGGRWVKQLTERLGLRARADVGLDVFNVQGGLDIDVTRWLGIALQYKYLNFDHEEGQGQELFRYDATEQGPLFGVAFRF